MDKIDNFGGNVEEISGEGIVAIFGLEPIEDAPRRAAHAGLAIRKGIDRSQSMKDAASAVIIGVHLTAAVIEQANGTRQLTAESRRLGRAGLATLVAGAAVHEVLASAPIGRLLKRWFKIEPALNESTYRVLAPGRSGGEADTGRWLSRFVGRDRELDWLQERVAQLAAGRGQVVGLVSEPGGGKSRLLYEFSQRLAGDHPVVYLEGRCVSYGIGIPYLPIRDLLRRTWQFDEADPPEAVAAKIQRSVELAGMDSSAYTPYLLRLFGLASTTEAIAGLSREAIKRRTFDTVRQVILDRGSAVVLAVEDLHWVDKTSEDFLTSVVDCTLSMPLLFVSTYRPGYRPPWIDRSYASQLALLPLSRTDSRTVVRAIVPQAQISQTEVETIVARGEGNPFFLEELALAAAGKKQESSEPNLIPHTIGEVLTARLDRLTDRQRRVLEGATVLGQREVPVQLLDEMLGAPPDLADRLQELVRLELLHERSDCMGRRYGFRHALIQEVAYDRLLTMAARTALHAAAGRALETLYADRIDEVLDQLAYHYARTNETHTAITYLTRFAEKATASYSLTEAVRALEEALAHAERLSEPSLRDQAIVRVVTKRAFPLVLLGSFEAALNGLTRYASHLDDVDDPLVTGPYYLWLGLVHAHMGNHPQAIRYANQCVEIATRANDKPTQGVAQVQLAIDCFFVGQYRHGAAHARQALALLDERSDPWWLAHAYWMLAWNLVVLGEFEPADDAAAKTAAIGDRAAEPRLQAYGLSTQGWIAALQQNTELARSLSERAQAIAPDPLSKSVVLTLSAYCQLASGQRREAVLSLQQAVSSFQAFHFREMEVWARVWLSEALLDTGDTEAAEHEASEALNRYPDIGFLYVIGVAQRVRGRIALAAKDSSVANEHLGKALVTFSSIDAHHEALRTRLDLARAIPSQDAKGEATRL